MHNILEEIIAYKKSEVDKLKSNLSIEEIKKKSKLNKRKKRNFFQAIHSKVNKKENALIAEIKKASPSRGIIRDDFNPTNIGIAYEKGGATCVSILTDKKYFQGNLNYIEEVKNKISLPVLRKDFIVDSYQIYESVLAGADCVLLIIGAFNNKIQEEKILLKKLFEEGIENELDILVEVHDERELEIALDLGNAFSYPYLLGINNRDLKTFKTTLDTTKNLVKKYKRDLENKIIVSESGIFTSLDIKPLNDFGVYSFLVGESLMRENNIEKATKQLLS